MVLKQQLLGAEERYEVEKEENIVLKARIKVLTESGTDDEKSFYKVHSEMMVKMKEGLLEYLNKKQRSILNGKKNHVRVAKELEIKLTEEKRKSQVFYEQCMLLQNSNLVTAN